MLFKDPEIINKAAQIFGNQSVVVNIEAKNGIHGSVPGAEELDQVEMLLNGLKKLNQRRRRNIIYSLWTLMEDKEV